MAELKDEALVGRLVAERLKDVTSRKMSQSLPPLDDTMRKILGRPCFACIREAEWLRKRGYEIRRRAEDEQAAVIHWMLGLYFEHGDKWLQAADEWLVKTAPANSALSAPTHQEKP